MIRDFWWIGAGSDQVLEKLTALQREIDRPDYRWWTLDQLRSWMQLFSLTQTTISPHSCGSRTTNSFLITGLWPYPSRTPAPAEDWWLLLNWVKGHSLSSWTKDTHTALIQFTRTHTPVHWHRCTLTPLQTRPMLAPSWCRLTGPAQNHAAAGCCCLHWQTLTSFTHK